jgi:hypothetical protein
LPSLVVTIDGSQTQIASHVRQLIIDHEAGRVKRVQYHQHVGSGRGDAWGHGVASPERRLLPHLSIWTTFVALNGAASHGAPIPSN